jgi:hypothetical protein
MIRIRYHGRMLPPNTSSMKVHLKVVSVDDILAEKGSLLDKD